MSAAEASQVMLAQKWDESIDPTGYWMSEKLDGIRAYFDGKHFYSRSGNRFNAPAFFTEVFPNIVLDGELWAGRGLFQKTTSIVKKTKNPVEEEWKDLKFVVFDAPKVKGTFEQRMQYLKSNVPANATHIAVLAVKKCTGLKHLKDTLKDVLEAGGEGLMLRQAGSFYERGRSDTLLKVKLFHDEEAKVTGYRKGNTNPKHRHLECELPNGVQFTLGNGFTEYEHTHPPPIGSVVTFQYQEVTNNGVPRFPSFMRVREDVTWEDVINNYNDDNKAKHIKRSPADCNKDPILFSNIKAINVEEVLNITPKSKKSPGTSPAKKNPASANNSSGAANAGSKGNAGLVPCKYGASCYQKNPMHFKQYSHPHLNNSNVNNNDDDNGDEEKADLDADVDPESDNENEAIVNKKHNDNDDNMEVEEDNNNNDNDDEDKMDQDAESDLPPCKYGANCYRQNPQHFKEFSHPSKPGTQIAPKSAALPKKANTTAPVKPAAAQPAKKSTIKANKMHSDDDNSDNSDHEQETKKSTAKVPQKKPQPAATSNNNTTKPKPSTGVDEKKKIAPTSSNNNTSTTSAKITTKSTVSTSAGSSDGVKRRALPDWAQTSLSDYQKKYLKSSTDGDM